MASPIHTTIDVPPIIHSQSESERGVTLKKAPPSSTIAICPAKITDAIKRNSPHPLSLKADRPLLKARALKRFQNWRNTNMVKKRLSS